MPLDNCWLHKTEWFHWFDWDDFESFRRYPLNHFAAAWNLAWNSDHSSRILRNWRPHDCSSFSALLGNADLDYIRRLRKKWTGTFQSYRSHDSCSEIIPNKYACSFTLERRMKYNVSFWLVNWVNRKTRSIFSENHLSHSCLPSVAWFSYF